MFRYPDKPMKATPDVLPTLKEGDWLAQAKPDGWRTLVGITPDGITLTSRHQTKIPASPEFLEATNGRLRDTIPPGTLLDAEWMGRRDGQPERLWFFDVLALANCWMGGEDTQTRFTALLAFIGEDQIVPWTTSGYDAFYAGSQKAPGVEGIVLKRMTAPYIGDTRRSVDNPHWLKIRWR